MAGIQVYTCNELTHSDITQNLVYKLVYNGIQKKAPKRGFSALFVKMILFRWG